MSEQEKAKVTEMVKKITALPEDAQRDFFSQAYAVGNLLDRYDLVPKGTANAENKDAAGSG